MKESEHGFFVPVIDAELCRGCNACQKACSRLDTLHRDATQPVAYRFVVNNKQERYIASSGGFCTELSRLIIRQGGVVFGVTLTPDFRAKYIEINSIQELWQIRGSKYIQADTTGCFQQISNRLKEKKLILFIGTACQVKALRARFGFNSEQLIAVDIACYGVPSYHLLDAYIRELNTGEDKLELLHFKNKSRGWRNNSLHLVYKSGRQDTSPAGSNPFIQGFDSRLCLNEACYSCQRNSDERLSDITCADNWGHEDTAGDDSHLGISSIICHTCKGDALIKQLADTSSITPISLQEAIAKNGGLTTKKESIPSERDTILKQLKKSPITPVIRKYIYSQGGKRLYFSIMGVKLYLPEFIYNQLRSISKHLRKLSRQHLSSR